MEFARSLSMRLSSVITRRMSSSSQSLRVGWIGTGVMGAHMACHVQRAGYPLTVYTRTREKANALIAEGATWADTPRAVAAESDVIFTILGFPTDVRRTVLDEKDGILAGLRPNAIVVDMTTSEPSLAKEIAAAVEARDASCAALDAPVSGGDVGARNATLSIMVGGNKEAFDRVKPLFDVMGKNVRHLGKAGSGQHTKMVNQILISTNMIGMVEGLLYGYKAGLNLNDVIAAVSSGAAGSWSISNYGPRILKGDLNPGFFVEHFVKDMEIALKEAEGMGLNLPGLALSRQLYRELMALGHSRLGTHSLILALAKLSNVDYDDLVEKNKT